MADGPTGLVVVDKAPGWTSHDVVAKLRGILRTKKVGHSGTLDPDATGVLLIGVGRATRLLRFLTDLPKEYVGDIVLGTETSTLDASGEVTATHDMQGTTIDAARAAARALTGDILQVPPMVSAIQIDGVRLHELARQGIEVEREARPVTVHQFSLEPTGDPLVLRATVRCSSGTYIRTLAADLGHRLGGGGHLRNLRRTAIGSFSVDQAKPLESISDADILPPAVALRDYASVVVDDEVAAAIANGKVLPAHVLGAPGAGPWAVLGAAGELLAVYEVHKDDTVKPAVVIGAATR
jgi:tRNA pseudouridine55 synthase